MEALKTSEHLSKNEEQILQQLIMEILNKKISPKHLKRVYNFLKGMEGAV